MSLDHHDLDATHRFVDAVDAELAEHAGRTALWPLVGVWLLAGAILTVAQGAEEGWLFPIGLALVVFWATGFLLARRPARWWRL